MARSGRAKSNATQSKSPTTRKSVQLPPRQNPEPDGSKEDQDRSPTSPTIRRVCKHNFADETLPSTPEEWIEFSQTKLRQAAATLSMADTVQALAEIEPDLLEFLMTGEEAVSEALCGLPFPTTREAWRESIHSLLVERFQLFFGRLPPKLTDRKIDEEGRRFTLLITALEALDHLGFNNEVKLEQKEETPDPFFKVKSKSQKNRKASISIANRARRNTTAVDPRVFKAVELEFPTTHKEALEVQSRLLLHLKEVFLASFANHELAGHARALFLKQPQASVSKKPTRGTVIETPADTPSSQAAAPGLDPFSRIRPLLVAKYLEEEDTLGVWSVVISTRAVAELRGMRKKDLHAFELVQKAITELSGGTLSDNNWQRLPELDVEVPIYYAEVSRDLAILYQVDLDTDVDAKVDQQFIRVYGVYTYAQLGHQMRALISHQLNRRGQEYCRRCMYRSTSCVRGETVTMPAHFPHQDSTNEDPSVSSPEAFGRTDSEGETNCLSSSLILERFTPLTKSLISSILNETDTAFLIHPSAKEKEAIYYDSACLVLGRSGTGKTTCIVHKILGIEMLFRTLKDALKPRQIFVTRSRMVVQHVQEHYRNLVKGTFKKLMGPWTGESDEQILVDLEDEDGRGLTLPPKYSMLEDHHFPLFLSFDELCSLLEADFGIQLGLIGEAPTQQHSKLVTPSKLAVEDLEHEYIKKAKRTMITYDAFLVTYWPRFNQRLKKGIDPTLLYNEFVGIIEGSESTLDTESGVLSREEYMGRSHKVSSFASHWQKNCIYELYEAYRKCKVQLGSYDIAERTHALVRAINSGVPGCKVDCLYIDEVQDNLMIDIKLLHALSTNPHGIYMSGDIAQTISAGNSFRFEDLKALMWRLEVQTEAVQRRKRSAIHPAIFQLSVNYRSHRGIISCANSVIQLISELFPKSIDSLNEETALVGGPLPVYFSGWEHGIAQFNQCICSEANTGINFGASQAILVRNETARAALREQVGDIGLILTLYESKALEFDDILLYNFFEDSLPSASTWRIVLAGIGPAPKFDELRHSVICTELKHLYVGLTRARKRCWIWDSSEKGDPMKVFWMRRGLVSHCAPGDPIPQLGVSSPKDSWAGLGRSLFNKQLYSQATFCFQKAGLVVERDIASAYNYRKQARLLQSANSVDEATRVFRSTAERFLQCARRSVTKQQISCYARSGECFLECGAWKSAAEAFLRAREFDLSANNYRRAGCFNEAVAVVLQHRDQMQKDTAEEIIQVARLEYLRTGNFMQAIKLFGDLEEQLEYMEDFGLNTGQIHLLKSQHRYEQAARIAFSEHNIMEGVRLLQYSNDADLARHAAEQALLGLWKVVPLNLQEGKLDTTIVAPLVEYLVHVKGLLDRDERDQLEVFEAILAQDITQLASLAQLHTPPAYHSGAPTSPSVSIISLICFSHSSGLLVPTKDWTMPEFISKFKLARNYFSQLLHLGRTLDLSSPSIRKLLGFESRNLAASKDIAHTETSSTEFWIHSTSSMFKGAQYIPGAHDSVQSDLGISSLAVSEGDTQRLARTVVNNILRSEIRNIASNDKVDYSVFVELCLEYAILGHCSQTDCRKQQISTYRLSDEQRQQVFSLRVQALIAQLEVIHTYPAMDMKESWFLRRIRSRQAYELLMPYFPPLGGLLCLDHFYVPGISRGLSLISTWCEDALHYLDPRCHGPGVLSHILICLDFASRIEGPSKKFATYVDRLHSRPLVSPLPKLMWRAPVYPYLKHSIVHDFIDFYARKSDTALSRMVQAVRHAVMEQPHIEGNVLLQALELIGREIIMQYRRYAHGTQMEGKFLLDRVLLPRSWALDILGRPPLIQQKPFILPHFIETICKEIEYLHNHKFRSFGPVHRFGDPLHPLMVIVLILRACRILVLLAVNINLSLPDMEMIRHQVGRLLNGPGNPHPLCARFATAKSWIDFQDALLYSPLNRGADELVFLSLRRDSSPSPFIPNMRIISYANIFPELIQKLFLNRATAQQMSTLQASGWHNPGAFADRVPSQVALGDWHTLTADEVRMGKKILLCYRSYSARRKGKAQTAGRIIWAYYRRYRLRHLAPQTATGDAIRKLHVDYMRDVEQLTYSPPLSNTFYQHKRTLLGYMPHVIVCLRGLEAVNRQEQNAKKKELQTASHDHLEKILSRIGACSAFAKKIKALITDLSPGSRFLGRLDAIQGRVERAVDARQAITKAFPQSAISPDLELHYTLGVEATLAPRLPSN